jgi:hypothetical protein
LFPAHLTFLELRLAYATFLIANTQDYHLATVQINRALKARPRVDIAFILFAANKTRQAIVSAKDNGTEEVTNALKQTSQYSQECKKYMKVFWDNLHKEVDLGTFSDVIRKIDKYEKKAEVIFKKVSKVLSIIYCVDVAQVSKECHSVKSICCVFRGN